VRHGASPQCNAVHVENSVEKAATVPYSHYRAVPDPRQIKTRSPAIARMADRAASVVKNNPRWRLGARHGGRRGHNLSKQALPIKRAHYEAK